MQGNESRSPGGATGFFRLVLSHENLFNYYQTNFSMMQFHKYSLTELENMIPWEREIYIMLLVQYLQEENQRLSEQQQR